MPPRVQEIWMCISMQVRAVAQAHAFTLFLEASDVREARSTWSATGATT